MNAINPADKKAGVVGYSVNIVKCPVTGKLTNCYYLTQDGRRVLAYDQAAADQIDLLANHQTPTQT